MAMRTNTLGLIALTMTAMLGSVTGCGEGESSGSARSDAPVGAAPPTTSGPAAEAGAPVELLSRGLEIVEVSRSDIGHARLASGLRGPVIMPEPAIVWRINVMSRSDKRITSIRTNVSYHIERRTIEVLPRGSTLGPMALLDVELVLPLPMGSMPPSINADATVVGVRFADGTTIGDAPDPMAMPGTAGTSRADQATVPAELLAMFEDAKDAPPAEIAESPFANARIVPDDRLIAKSEVSIVRAEYGDRPDLVDVTEGVRAWLNDDAWPTPLTVSPEALAVDDPAPGRGKLLTIFLDAGQQRVVLRARDGETLRVGGQDTLGSRPLAAPSPIVLGDYEIVAASYGNHGDWVNAMPALRSKRGDADHLDFVVDGSLISEGDAIEREPLGLTLYFRKDSKLHFLTVDEGERLRVPPKE